MSLITFKKERKKRAHNTWLTSHQGFYMKPKNPQPYYHSQPLQLVDMVMILNIAILSGCGTLFNIPMLTIFSRLAMGILVRTKIINHIKSN